MPDTGRERRSRAASCALLLVLATATLFSPTFASAEKPKAHVAKPAADAATSHRRFDDAAYWSKVFDDPKRDAWQKPDVIVAALELREGSVVADIGAGTGYFEKRLSNAVGESGTVYALEVEPNLVAHLRDRADKEKTANVIPLLASSDNPRLPAASLDAALIADSYHHIDGRRAWLARLARSMKPGGRVVIVDWKPGKQPEGPSEEDHKIAPEKVLEEMKAAGFEALPASDPLPYQYLLSFRAPAARATAR